MFKKNQKVKVTTGPAVDKIGKVVSYDKNHLSGFPWFIKSDKNAPEEEMVMGRFLTSELAPIIKRKKNTTHHPGQPSMPDMRPAVDKPVGK